jgi:hypothetical protein
MRLLTCPSRQDRREQLIGIEIGTGVQIGMLRERTNDACPTPDGRGYQASSMLQGHGGHYRVTRLDPRRTIRAG